MLIGEDSIGYEVIEHNEHLKFFNIDVHISVIADVQNIFRTFGHEVEDHSLSGHTWVMDKYPASLKVINKNNWKEINQKMVDDFYQEYKDYLESFDGFIVTHASSFALLYGKFNKPIIIINSTRYSGVWISDLGKLDWLNSYLKEGVENNQIFLVSNNKGDQNYLKYHTGLDSEWIPSLCLYTNATYTGTNQGFIAKDTRSGLSYKEDFHNQNLIKNLHSPYTWQELYDFQGIIHFPYQISTMSIFEQYSANIPLFFPSKDFILSLQKEYPHKILSELSFYQVLKKSLPDIKANPDNINDPAVLQNWIDAADFYDLNNMPYIQYFNSFQELEYLLENVNLEDISQKMREYNQHRKELVFNKWKSILEKIKITNAQSNCEEAKFSLKVISEYYKGTDISQYPLQNTDRTYKPEKTWLISYAKSNIEKQNMNNMMVSAVLTGLFDIIIPYGPYSIAPQYYQSHQKILSQTKGAGYWLWKPYLILKTLQMMPENDVLVYLDHDNIFRDTIKDTIKLTEKEDIVAFSSGHSNRQYMKKTVVDKIFNGDETIRDKMQLETGLMLLKNNLKTRDLVSQWLSHCEDPNLLTDIASENEYSDFREHRYAQALFTATYYKNNLNFTFGDLTYKDMGVVKHYRNDNCSLIELNFNKTLSKNDPLSSKKEAILSEFIGCRTNYPEWHAQYTKLTHSDYEIKRSFNAGCYKETFALQTLLDYYKNADISTYPIKNTNRSYKQEKRWIMSYGNHGVHVHNRNNAMLSTIITGLFDVIIPYGPHNIEPQYYNEHKAIFSQPRGGGYWLWKPYLILKTLQMMPENDTLLFIDSATIFREAIKDILKSIEKEDIVVFSPGHTNRQYMKRTVIEKIFNGDQSIRDKLQFESGFIFLRNTAKVRDFISEWMSYCEDPELLTDIANDNEYSDFKDHRHDQALLTATY